MSNPLILHVIFLLFIALDTLVVGQDTWCGKYYRQGEKEVEPGGRYGPPELSPDPLLLFRCDTEIKPYIHGEDKVANVVVDIGITHQNLSGSFPMLDITPDRQFQVTIHTTDDGHTLAKETLSLGMKQPISFPLDQIQARASAYDIQCQLRVLPRDPITKPVVYQMDSVESIVMDVETPDGTAVTRLYYLPPNPHGRSTVKMDVIRSVLLVRDQSSSSSSGGGVEGTTPWKPLIPFGFYTSFDDYLAKNLSILDDAKQRGFNFVHPVPTFGNMTALDLILDRMEELGLWLVYDMRWHYKNRTAVTEQVERIRARKNILVWYTADEPDGWGDELDAPRRTAEWIEELDGYRPVSLVLNCNNYYLSEYTRSTDILFTDVYPIGINATYSTVYHTPCTPSFGVCGCDECKGRGVEDVSTRTKRLSDMLRWTGQRKPIWGVPQAFGEQSFWSRQPTGREFTAMTMIYFIHGATGISPWIAPTTAGIMDAATRIAKALPNITPFLTHAAVTKHYPKLELVLSSTRDESTFATHDQTGSTFSPVSEEWPINGIVAAQWDTPDRGSLLILVNLLDRPLRVSVSPTNDNLKTRRTEMLLSEGVEIQEKQVEMGNELLVDVEAVGSAVIVLT
ncbi:hypothetical protein FRC18_000994 [Serendipita sp. 400]|nr:hypothetical protein FRC18_000994 [Serendipita sp. 400]